MSFVSGQLMPGFIVSLDARMPWCGGSWVPLSGDPLQAYGQDIIRVFHDKIRTLNPLMVFDLGANTGSFCLLAKFIPQMHVLAIEPVKSVHDFLTCNVLANGLIDRINVVRPLALSDYNGRGIMTIPLEGSDTGLSYLDDRMPNMSYRREEVEVMTLDSLCDELNISSVQAIKIDVEHSEKRVLVGGEKIIRRCRPIILVEASQPQVTIPVLKDFGYTITDYGTDILAE